MKIYTKTGDRGHTALLGGARVEKSSPRIELLGTIDELNSALGLAMSLSQSNSSAGLLERTQRQLFAIGAELARPELESPSAMSRVDVWIGQLEMEIDRHTGNLPPLTNFILPGGSAIGAGIHFARAVCRRAERAFFANSVPHGQSVGVYLNRLGDWLFVLARFVNQADGQSEKTWTAGSE